MKRIVLCFCISIFYFASCASGKLTNKQRESISSLKKVAIIEFAILPPYAEASNSLFSIINVEAFKKAEKNIYPQILDLHKNLVDDFSDFAGEYWSKNTSTQIVYSKKLYKLNSYQSLPSKGVKTYPTRLQIESTTFPEITIAKESFNFFDFSKNYSVLKYGIYQEDITASTGVLSDENKTEYESEATINQKIKNNISGICKELDVNAVVMISTYVVSSNIAFGDATRYSLLYFNIYDDKGALIVNLKRLVRCNNGKAADIKHYNETINHFKELYIALINELVNKK